MGHSQISPGRQALLFVCVYVGVGTGLQRVSSTTTRIQRPPPPRPPLRAPLCQPFVALPTPWAPSPVQCLATTHLATVCTLVLFMNITQRKSRTVYHCEVDCFSFSIISSWFIHLSSFFRNLYCLPYGTYSFPPLPSGHLPSWAVPLPANTVPVPCRLLQISLPCA